MDNILFVSASSSPVSVNCCVMKLLLQLQKFPYLDLSVFSYSIPLLVYSMDEAKSNIPDQIISIYKIISKYDKLVFFAPEHNSFFSAFFKNILDWLSIYDKDFLHSKEVIVVSVSETQRSVRRMENAVKTSLSQFSPKSVKFVNFNKFSEEIKHKRLIQLLKEII